MWQHIGKLMRHHDAEKTVGDGLAKSTKRKLGDDTNIGNSKKTRENLETVLQSLGGPKGRY